MERPDKVLIIDDDQNTNLLYTMIIRHVMGKTIEIKTFTQADDGINYLNDEPQNLDCNVVMFLDINMPVISGWEALSMLAKSDERVRKKLTIFMVSSSIDPNDKKRSIEHPYVTDFMEKPLTVEKIKNLFGERLDTLLSV